MNRVYLALGSNLGDKRSFLDQALDHLASHEFITLGDVGNFVETPAQGTLPQPDYLNTVCEISTLLSPQELLITTKEIEKQLGRQTKGDYTPRTCDIDILFYNDAIVSEDDLVIPHPLLHERVFVLQPLHDIAPSFVHPLLQEPISTLYGALTGY